MESFKKFLPYVLVAIIFAVGGYFIGAGGLSNQGAALYKAVDKTAEPVLFSVFNSNGGCWRHYWDGRPDVDGVLGADGGCHFKMDRSDNNAPAPKWAVYWSNGACWAHYDDGGIQQDDEGMVDSSGGCTFLKYNPNNLKPIMKPGSSVPATTSTTSAKSTPTTR